MCSLYYYGVFYIINIFMKKLWLWLLTFLIGQSIVLYKKDTRLQKEIKKNPDFIEKCKILFKKVYDVNKEMVIDLKSKIPTESLEKIEQVFAQKEVELQQYIQNIKDALTANNEDQIAKISASAHHFNEELEKFLEHSKEIASQEFEYFVKKYNLSSYKNEITHLLQWLVEKNSPKKTPKKIIAKK